MSDSNDVMQLKFKGVTIGINDVDIPKDKVQVVARNKDTDPITVGDTIQVVSIATFLYKGTNTAFSQDKSLFEIQDSGDIHVTAGPNGSPNSTTDEIEAWLQQNYEFNFAVVGVPPEVLPLRPLKSRPWVARLNTGDIDFDDDSVDIDPEHFQIEVDIAVAQTASPPSDPSLPFGSDLPARVASLEDAVAKIRLSLNLSNRARVGGEHVEKVESE